MSANIIPQPIYSLGQTVGYSYAGKPVLGTVTAIHIHIDKNSSFVSYSLDSCKLIPLKEADLFIPAFCHLQKNDKLYIVSPSELVECRILSITYNTDRQAFFETRRGTFRPPLKQSKHVSTTNKRYDFQVIFTTLSAAQEYFNSLK